MKTFNYFLGIPLMTVFALGGCSDKDEVENPPVAENENLGDNKPGTNEASSQKIDFTFKSFELNVENADGKKYEAEYETEGAETEASIDDEINDKKLAGDEAMEQLAPKLEKLEFNQDAPEDEVIAEVVKDFELNEDFKNLELDITYSDGETKEYTESK
ncbi:YusW family protein [Peribacillus glennii]|uniref:YusW family protein n=1 Tax=Peribacillus glennii TaxID=2303991 RepID=UPI0013140001|nr:YusW family protein [Peribacillus glennii]